MRNMCVVSKEPCASVTYFISCQNYTKSCGAKYESIFTGTMCVTFIYTILLVFGILSEGRVGFCYGTKLGGAHRTRPYLLF